MAVGLACGIGYPGFAALFTVIILAVLMIYDKIELMGGRSSKLHKVLKVTVPEDLDYSGMFDDLLASYTKEANLVSIKTTNLGSLNKLTYDITLKESGTEKKFIDELRTRNGNLEISLAMPASESEL